MVGLLHERPWSDRAFSLSLTGMAAVSAFLVIAVMARFRKFDIARNNASIKGKTAPLCDEPSENWLRAIDVDLSSVFYCLTVEIPELLKRGGGAIVNTA